MIDLDRKHYVVLFAFLLGVGVWDAANSIDWGVIALAGALYFDAVTPN